MPVKEEAEQGKKRIVMLGIWFMILQPYFIHGFCLMVVSLNHKWILKSKLYKENQIKIKGSIPFKW